MSVYRRARNDPALRGKFFRTDLRSTAVRTAIGTVAGVLVREPIMWGVRHAQDQYKRWWNQRPDDPVLSMDEWPANYNGRPQEPARPNPVVPTAPPDRPSIHHRPDAHHVGLYFHSAQFAQDQQEYSQSITLPAVGVLFWLILTPPVASDPKYWFKTPNLPPVTFFGGGAHDPNELRIE